MSCLLPLVLAAALSSPAPLALEVDQQRDTLRVSFQLLEPFPVSIEEALPSGAEVTVRYPLRVRSPRALWWDRKHWKGELVAPQEVINQGLQKDYDLGGPVLFQVNGDAAVDALLNAHEFAAADDLTKDRNVTAVHAQFLRKDQIPPFVKYHIRPSFYTLHTYYFADAHIRNRGKAQAMYISPMRDAIDAGLHPTNHTDAVVAPLDQMFMLWSAVNRISRGGEVIGADQRVTPLEGLKAMTIWVAEQYGEQASKGSLEVGKRADLVILDRNPLTVDRMAIKDIRVVETIKDGNSVYRAP